MTADDPAMRAFHGFVRLLARQAASDVLGSEGNCHGTGAGSFRNPHPVMPYGGTATST